MKYLNYQAEQSDKHTQIVSRMNGYQICFVPIKINSLDFKKFCYRG